VSGTTFYERLSASDVDHFTAEDVKALMRLWFLWSASLILNTGVRQGKFAKNEDGSYRLK
jgi:hypothetical protein